MDMPSPYLLAPELQSSRESLHSLSRTIHQQEDPYRPISTFIGTDEKGYPSSQRKGGSSIMSGSSGPSRLHDTSNDNLLSNAARMSRTGPPRGYVPPPRQNSLPQSIADATPAQPYDATASNPLIALSPVHGSMRSLSPGIEGLGINSNPPTSLLDRQSPVPSPAAGPIDLPEPAPTMQQTANRKSPPVLNSLPTNPRPARKQSLPAEIVQQPPKDDESDYGDGFKVTPPSPSHMPAQIRSQRYSMDVPPEEFAQAGLGAPGFDPRRLSMGFRPLPPDAVTESDDPELRANRIRSFYKEYFDESKPAPQGQYIEDYEENYLGDAAYFDADTNNFVMPGALPITRRAMTPPPRGPRFQGPPRAMHGSMSSRGPPPGPRAYSSASGRMGPPGRGPPKKVLPPPSPLTTLPAPSNLKDDSFAIFNSTDFAPPSTFRDRQAGRPDSPGLSRPYSPAVAAAKNITASSFDELAPMPSPYDITHSVYSLM